MLKATAGGGGKGMRAVWKDEFTESMGWSSSRICRCFGNDGMYLEKLIEDLVISKFRFWGFIRKSMSPF
jgi:acetyl-CoA carboxylase biotin carboxylase subunit